MRNTIVINWWTLAIRGVAGIVLGIAAFALTGITLVVLIALFAAYLLVDGLFALIAGVRGRHGLLVAEGVLGLLAGALAIWRPGIAILVIVVLVGVWAILTGVIEIIAAVELRRVIHNEWLLGVAGAVSVIFGVLVAINPLAGIIVLVWLVGGYSLLFGVLFLALAIRLRSYRATLTIRSFE